MTSSRSEELPPDLRGVPGAEELLKWFGYWPSFHDAEVLNIHLNRHGRLHMEIETWEMTKEIDDKGHYKLRKKVVVAIALEGITACDLADFNQQNVISSLSISKTANGYTLALEPCYGLSGTIEAASVLISIKQISA